MGIPERLVEIRERNGYTRRKLSEELQKPYATITKYETGEREPGHSYIIEIAKKFGVTTDYILGVSNDAQEQQKNPPTPEEPEVEGNIIAMSEFESRFYNGLVNMGLIKAGVVPTRQQQHIIAGVLQILAAAFVEREDKSENVV